MNRKKLLKKEEEKRQMLIETLLNIRSMNPKYNFMKFRENVIKDSKTLDKKTIMLYRKEILNFLTRPQLRNLLKTEDLAFWEKEIIAQRTGDTNILRTLAESNSMSIRMAVAGNPKTPKDCLKRLLKDKDTRVANEAKFNLAA